jgi:hypothetical protein
MSTKKNEQEYVPMAVSKNVEPQPESRSLLIATTTTTTSVVDTINISAQGNRDNWSNRIVYLLSIIGFVVDLGRVFPF